MESAAASPCIFTIGAYGSAAGAAVIALGSLAYVYVASLAAGGSTSAPRVRGRGRAYGARDRRRYGPGRDDSDVDDGDSPDVIAYEDAPLYDDRGL